MKKIYFLCGLFFFLSNCLNAQGNFYNLNGWETYKIKGRVESFIEYSTIQQTIDGGWDFTKIEDEYLTTVNFDLNGNIIDIKFEAVEGSKEALYSEMGWSFKYDENGFKNEAIRWYEKNGLINSFPKKFQNLIDKNGNLIERTEYENGESGIKEKFKYDELGNMIELKEYFSNGRLGKTMTFNYDKNGNAIIQYSKDEKTSKIISCSINQYDYNGNINLENDIIFLGENHELPLDSRKSFKYKYDSNGNWELRTEYDFIDNGTQNSEGKALRCTLRLYNYF